MLFIESGSAELIVIYSVAVKLVCETLGLVFRIFLGFFVFFGGFHVGLSDEKFVVTYLGTSSTKFMFQKWEKLGEKKKKKKKDSESQTQLVYFSFGFSQTKKKSLKLLINMNQSRPICEGI